MVRSKFVKRSVSVLMAALVVMGGAAAFNGNVSPEVSAAQTSTAQTKATLANQSFLSATAITKGSSVTVYGKMGTTGSVYNYAYYYKKHSSDTWMKIKGYSSTTSVKITPAAATNYDIKVYAKDAKGKIYVKTLYLKVYAPLVNKSTVSKDKIALGSSVTMKGYASGGSGSYEYAYYYKKTGATTWKTLQKYSDSKTATFKPTEKGDYDLMIKVKSPVGGIAKKTYKLNVLNRLVNNSTVSKTVVEKGGTVSVKAAATGGFGGYTYSYSYRAKGETTWMLLKGYSTTTIYKMTMPDAGTYQVLVKAKDSAGNVVSKTLTVTVNVAGLEGKVAAINSTIIKAGMSEYEKVKAIHDWIINNTQYDTIGVITGKVPATSFTAEGLFETHVAVCDGYSKAFQLLCQRAGIDCVCVEGTATEFESRLDGTEDDGHMWNCVKLGGDWYHVDVTWNDGDAHIQKYAFLNLSTEEIKRTHAIGPMFGEVSSEECDYLNTFVPECNSMEYNYFYKSCPCISDLEDDGEVIAALIQTAKKHGMYLDVRIDSALDYDETTQAISESYGYRWLEAANHYNNDEPRISAESKYYIYKEMDVITFSLAYE